MTGLATYECTTCHEPKNIPEDPREHPYLSRVGCPSCGRIRRFAYPHAPGYIVGLWREQRDR